MSTPIRNGLIFVLAILVAFANSPAAFADKKDSSNSANSDNKEKKDKDNQNDQRRSRDRRRDDDQNTSTQQIQKVFQGNQGNNDKQGGSNNTQQLIGRDLPGNQSKKSPQIQDILKQKQLQNNKKQSDQQENFQQLNNKYNWQTQNKRDRKELHNWTARFGGPQPFSKQWYKDHPKAWHHHHHDNDDTWKVVTAAGVLGYLGWQASQPRTVVIYEPVPYDTLFVSRQGVVIDPARGDWKPLGVYSLMVSPDDANTRMMDLALDRHGHIRGSYFDMISGASYNVAGIIDQRTQYAQWSLESNRQLTFYTPLDQLMQPQGFVYVQLPSGQRQQWQLVRTEGGGY